MKFPVNYIAITQGFNSSHKGIDLGWKEDKNQPIYACDDGKVMLIDKQDKGGNVIYITHANGLTSIYGHLDKVLVKKGQQVKKDQQIATMGKTGIVTGEHCHFGLYKGNYKKNSNAVNPLDYLEVYPNQIVASKTKNKYELKTYIPFTKGTYQCLVNMYIRKTPKITTHVKVKDTTKESRDALKSKKLTAKAIFKKGTQFTALEIINNKDDSVWAKNYNGYICIADKINKYCKKIN